MPTAAAGGVRKWQTAAVRALAITTALAAAAAALLGLSGAAHPISFVTVRGGVVDLFGAAIYRYDSGFSGAGNRETDVVSLLIALPLLIISVLGCRRGSLRWQLVVTGAFAYFLYVSASMAVGAAFNPVFLGYVIAFAARLWGFGCRPSAVLLAPSSRVLCPCRRGGHLRC